MYRPQRQNGTNQTKEKAYYIRFIDPKQENTVAKFEFCQSVIYNTIYCTDFVSKSRHSSLTWVNIFS